MPSSALNSSTPQCVERPVVLLSTLNSIGYSMCKEAAARRRCLKYAADCAPGDAFMMSNDTFHEANLTKPVKC